MTAHCLFEQSGTFKNEFKKLGIEALDYVEPKKIGNLKKDGDKSVKTKRSMIHPQYASRFIRQYII